MLPYDVWYHYYDYGCPFCDGGKVNPREELECEECNQEMCEDCLQKNYGKCHVCEEKLERDEDASYVFVCEDCMDYCEECKVTFHSGCAKEHRQTCNRSGQLKRELAKAEKTIQETKESIKNTERMLVELHSQLEEANDTKNKVVKRLRNLEKSSNKIRWVAGGDRS